MSMKEVASHTPPAFKGIALDAKCKCGHEWGHHQMVEPHKCITGEQEQGCGCAAFRPVGLRTTPLRAAIKSMAVEGELEALQSVVDKACAEIDSLRASNRELLAALEASHKQLAYVSAFLTAIREDIQAGDSKDFADKFCEIVVMQDGLAFVIAQAEAAIQRAKP